MTQKWKTVILSLVVTLIVLFGGYQGYQYLKIEKPVNAIFATQKHISIVKIDFQPGNVQIQANVKPNYSTIEKLPLLVEQLNQTLGEGSWNLTFTDPRTPILKQAWKEMVFGIREGMQTRKYTLIQTTVKNVSSKHHLFYDLTMDEQYVYLMLRDGNKTWYQILPLKEVK